MLFRKQLLAPLLLTICSQIAHAQPDFDYFDDFFEDYEYTTSEFYEEDEDFSTLFEYESEHPTKDGKAAESQGASFLEPVANYHSGLEPEYQSEEALADLLALAKLVSVSRSSKLFNIVLKEMSDKKAGIVLKNAPAMDLTKVTPKNLNDFLTDHFNNQILFIEKTHQLNSPAGAELFTIISQKGITELTDKMIDRGFELAAAGIHPESLVCNSPFYQMAEPVWKKVRDYMFRANNAQHIDMEILKECAIPGYPNVGQTAIMVEYYQNPEHTLTEAMATYLATQIVTIFIRYLDLAEDMEKQNTLVFLGEALPGLISKGGKPKLDELKASTYKTIVPGLPHEFKNSKLVTVLGRQVLPYLDLDSKVHLTKVVASRNDTPLAAYLLRTPDSNEILQRFSILSPLYQQENEIATGVSDITLATLALSCQIPQPTLATLAPGNPLIAASLEYCNLFESHYMTGIMRSCVTGKGEIGRLSYCQTLQQQLSETEKSIISSR